MRTNQVHKLKKIHLEDETEESEYFNIGTRRYLVREKGITSIEKEIDLNCVLDDEEKASPESDNYLSSEGEGDLLIVPVSSRQTNESSVHVSDVDIENERDESSEDDNDTVDGGDILQPTLGVDDEDDDETNDTEKELPNVGAELSNEEQPPKVETEKELPNVDVQLSGEEQPLAVETIESENKILNVVVNPSCEDQLPIIETEKEFPNVDDRVSGEDQTAVIETEKELLNVVVNPSGEDQPPIIETIETEKELPHVDVKPSGDEQPSFTETKNDIGAAEGLIEEPMNKDTIEHPSRIDKVNSEYENAATQMVIQEEEEVEGNDEFDVEGIRKRSEVELRAYLENLSLSIPSSVSLDELRDLAMKQWESKDLKCALSKLKDNELRSRLKTGGTRSEMILEICRNGNPKEIREWIRNLGRSIQSPIFYKKPRQVPELRKIPEVRSLVIQFTNVPGTDIKEYESKLGGRDFPLGVTILNENDDSITPSKSITHLVVGGDAIKRSKKLAECMSLIGSHSPRVVSESWLKDCLKERNVVDSQEYAPRGLYADPTNQKKKKISMEDVLRHRDEASTPLFSGKMVCMATECKGFKTALEYSGATIVKSMEDADFGLMLKAPDNEKRIPKGVETMMEEAKETGKAVYNMTWFTHSVINGVAAVDEPCFLVVSPRTKKRKPTSSSGIETKRHKSNTCIATTASTGKPCTRQATDGLFCGMHKSKT